MIKTIEDIYTEYTREVQPDIPGYVARIYGYVRMSKATQVDSPETQKFMISQYTKNHGQTGEIAFMEDRAVSGPTPFMKRTAGKELLRVLRRGDWVIVTHLDRCCRNTLDFLWLANELNARGVHFHIVNLFGSAIDTSSPMGMLIVTMLAGFATFERAMISIRTKEALAAKKGQGVKHARHAGYGFTWDRQKVNGKMERIRITHDEERAVMKAIAQWRIRDDPFTWEEIASALKKQGVLTKDGKEWDQNRVRRAFAAEMDLRAKAAGLGK